MQATNTHCMMLLLLLLLLLLHFLLFTKAGHQIVSDLVLRVFLLRAALTHSIDAQALS